jgi:uncharacterized protein (TIGR00290 family)
MVHVLRQQGLAPAALLTTTNEAFDRVSMHGVRATLLQAQARALALPLWNVPLPWPCTNEIYEERLGGAVRRAVAEGFTHVAFGDLFLEDVRRYREERLADSGLTPLFPLWELPTRSLATEMIASGLRARIVTLDPRVLSNALAGREFDEAFLAELPPTVDPCGERGEFHTFAFAGPMFSEEIQIQPGPIVERDGFVFCDLKEAIRSQG